MHQIPTLLALDFDGVICDGLVEYFHSAWLTYLQTWSPPDSNPPDGLAEVFYRLRPLIETGWEMPILIRALILGKSESELLENWSAIAQHLLAQEQQSASALMATLDGLRDQHIQTDLDHWLGLHRFYPGVIERLQQLMANGPELVIISTKEGRFIRQLLAQQGLVLAEQQIFGKETNRPKREILKEFYNQGQRAVWFIEDRLATLQSIKTLPQLADVQLFLANWGYNTDRDRSLAQADDRIRLLSLSQFSQPFSAW